MLRQIDMEGVVVNFLLAIISCVDIRFRRRNKVTPFNAGNIRVLSRPYGRSAIAYTFRGGVAVEHVLTDDIKCHACMIKRTVGTAAVLFLKKIGVCSIGIREDDC